MTNLELSNAISLTLQNFSFHLQRREIIGTQEIH